MERTGRDNEKQMSEIMKETPKLKKNLLRT
jgi:hypothetical protein